MIKSLTIRGFKSVSDTTTLDLGAVNVFIGANGSGKSNILEALGVVSAAAYGTVDDEALDRRGVRLGLPRLYKSSFKGHRLLPDIYFCAQSDAAKYDISILNPLENPEPAWEYKTEGLYDGDHAVSTLGIRSSKANFPRNRGLAALKIVDLPDDNPAAELLRTLQDFAIYSPNTPTLRGMISETQRRPVGLTGGGLADAVQELLGSKDEDEKDIYNEIIDLLDWVESFDTATSASTILSPSVARPKRVLRFTDRYMSKNRNVLSAYDASEGALYILFVALLCNLKSGPACFAIDNIDQALNPRLVQRLMQNTCAWIVRSGKQLLCTAHNPIILDGLPLGDDRVRLFVVERDRSGQTIPRRVTITDKLRTMAQDKGWPLSRLWVMGHLGGVPDV